MTTDTLLAANTDFAQSILSGLKRTPKYTEPRWLYDAVGAKLFEAICELDTYYVTRVEMGILRAHAADIADTLGERVSIVEPGSGAALKVRPLLDALGARAEAYVPIDIAAAQLDAVAAELGKVYPTLRVLPVATDFFAPFTMPRVDNGVVFFPGSTIGNMPADDGVSFINRMLDQTGASRLLVGFDLVKDKAVLELAYDDPAGVTRAFKLNVLHRINRELGADFDISQFRFEALYNESSQAIEMYLTSERDQSVTIAGETIDFAANERISTEDSRKYTLESFARFAEACGLSPVKSWTDDDNYFALMLLTR